MTQVQVYLVNSFTKNGAGGNPAGVVLNADNLSESQKLKIAKQVGFSETAFVSRSTDADFAVSFFTPTDEVDFCGHATLATFSVLFEQGLINAGQFTQSTKAGVLEVKVEPNAKVVMTQRSPEFIKRFDVADIAPLIGLDPHVLEATHLPIEAISTGLPDIIVPVPSGYLDKLKVNSGSLSAFSKAHNVIGIHVFELNEQGADITASCRNFAPLFGIEEESATGSSSGALACFLTRYVPHLIGAKFIFEQGRAMRCRSELSAYVESNEQEVTQVLVGGNAHTFGTQTVEL